MSVDQSSFYFDNYKIYHFIKRVMGLMESMSGIEFVLILFCLWMQNAILSTLFQQSTVTRQGTLIDLFKTPNLRKKTLTIYYLW